MSMLKKRLQYFGINGLFFAGLWYGFKVGVPWVATATTIYTWFVVAVCLLTVGIFAFLISAFPKRKVDVDTARNLQDKLGGSPYSVPFFVDVGLDVGVLYFLFAMSQFTLLGAYAVITFCSLYLRYQISKVARLSGEVVERSRVKARFERMASGNQGNTPDTFENDDEDLFRMGIIDTTGSDD